MWRPEPLGSEEQERIINSVLVQSGSSVCKHKFFFPTQRHRMALLRSFFLLVSIVPCTCTNSMNQQGYTFVEVFQGSNQISPQLTVNSKIACASL